MAQGSLYRPDNKTVSIVGQRKQLKANATIELYIYVVMSVKYKQITLT